MTLRKRVQSLERRAAELEREIAEHRRSLYFTPYDIMPAINEISLQLEKCVTTGQTLDFYDVIFSDEEEALVLADDGNEAAEKAHRLAVLAADTGEPPARIVSIVKRNTTPVTF